MRAILGLARVSGCIVLAAMLAACGDPIMTDRSAADDAAFQSEQHARLDALLPTPA